MARLLGTPVMVVVTFSLVTPVQSTAGDRPDIYSFTGPQRADLYSQMSAYITEPVILDHLDPPNDKHGSSRFLPWHREYIKHMEDFLISQNRPQFVPLPDWNPATPIPGEFLAGGGVDPDCPTTVHLGHTCASLSNSNPGISLPASLSTQLCSQTSFPSFRSTLENSYHNGVHVSVGGAMGAFKSPAAPIFWLWHGFADDVWFDWQCVCNLDEGTAFDPYTAGEKQTDLEAGIADAWMQDSPADIANEPNNETGSVLWQSRDIWVRNTQATSVGLTRFLNEHQHQNPEYAANPPDRPYIYVKVRNRGCNTISGNLHVYWANASTGLTWPTDFTEVATSPVALANIDAGREHVGEFHWLDIPQPTVATGDHFCLVARFVASPTTADPITGEGTNVSVYGNVKNSNQIAWKNLTIVDDVANNMLVIIRNISREGELVRLAFTVPPEQIDESFFDHGAVTIDLGQELYERWVENGAQGEGIKPLGACCRILILNDGASIDALPIAFGDEHLVAMQFEPGAPLCEDDRTVFELTVSAFERETLLGGNTYEIRPGSILPSPEFVVEAVEPQVDCSGGRVTLKVDVPDATAFQWFLDGVPIPGADGNLYAASQSGQYSVLATYENGCDRLSLPIPVEVQTPPLNDEPCDATFVEIGEPTPFDIYCATAAAGEATPGPGSGPIEGCYSTDGWCERDPEVQNSVWYLFTAPASGAVTIHAGDPNHQGDHDHMVNTQLAVWKAESCQDYATYSLVAANDDSGNHGIWGTDPALHDLGGLVPGSNYYIQIDGFRGMVGKNLLLVEDSTSLDTPDESPPVALALSPSAPNPFRTRTTVSYSLPEASTVSLRVFDATGREVRTLIAATAREAGTHRATWDGRDARGRRAPAGVYFYRLDAGGRRLTGRVVLAP